MKEWKRERPNEIGFYWFYGYRSDFAKRFDKKDLRVAKVTKCANSIMIVADGAFMWDDADGWWKKMDTPELPLEDA